MTDNKHRSEGNQNAAKERVRRTSTEELSRRSILRGLTVASTATAVTLPNLAIDASAAPADIVHKQLKFATITAEINEVRDRVQVALGGIDWPLYAPVKNASDEKVVYVTNYSESGISVVDPSDTTLIATNEGINQISSIGTISFDRLPVHSNSFGSSSFISGASGPRVKVNSNHNKISISTNGEEMTVNKGETEEIVAPYTVDTRSASYEAPITLQCEYSGSIDILGHNNGILIPMTNNYQEFINMVRSSDNNRNGRRYDRYTVKEFGDIKAFGLLDKTEGGSQ